jgi:hypothetical protein
MTVERPRPHNTACICAGCQALRHQKSARSVNLYGLASTGPVETKWIRERWKAIGGKFYLTGGKEAYITEAQLFAAVRAGRIRL